MDDKASLEPDPGLEVEVARARAGDRDALESVVRAVQKDVYRVALRFLWRPQDAEDATQEILIRVVAGLGSFRGDSSFRTWVYRVACNTLLSLRKKGRMERQSVSFDEFGDDLARGLSDDSLAVEYDLDEALLLEEVKIGCTLAMLMCLDRNHRLAGSTRPSATAVATRRRQRHSLAGFTRPHRETMKDVILARARDNRFRKAAGVISIASAASW